MKKLGGKILIISLLTITFFIIIVISISRAKQGEKILNIDQLNVYGSNFSADQFEGKVQIDYRSTSDCSIELSFSMPPKLANKNKLYYNIYINSYIGRGFINTEVFGERLYALAKSKSTVYQGPNMIQLELNTIKEVNEIKVIRFIFYKTEIAASTLSIKNITLYRNENFLSSLYFVPKKVLFIFVSSVIFVFEIIKALLVFLKTGFNNSALGWSISLFAMGFILFCSAWIFVKKTLKNKLSLDLYINTFVIMTTQMILSMILLSFIGQMYLSKLFVLNVAVLLILILKYRTFPDIVDVLWLFRQTFLWLRRNFILSIILSFIGVNYILALFQAIYEPPSGYDSMAYHLPMAIEWIKTGKILPIYFALFLSYMPGTGELLSATQIMTIKSDFLVSSIQFPFLIISAISIYSIGKTIGLNKKASLIASLFLFSTPVFVEEVQRLYIDIIFMSFVLLTLHYALKYLKTKNRTFFFLSAVTAGLLMGTKYIGMHFLILIIPVLIISLIIHSKIQILKFIFFIKNSLLWISITLLVGGYWYIRNWVITGNPIFPSPVTIGKFALFQSGISPYYMDILKRVTLINNLKGYDITPYKEHIYLSFGQPLLITLGIGIVCALILILIEKQRISRKILNVYLILLPLFTIIVYSTIPFSTLIHIAMRYVFIFVPLASLSYAFIASINKYLLKSVSITLVGLLIYALIPITNPNSLINPPTTLIFRIPFNSLLMLSIIAFVILRVALSFKPRTNITRKKSILGVISVTVIACLVMSGALKDYEIRKFSWYEKHYYEVGHTAAWLNSNTRGDNIAFSPNIDRPYPFYGSGFKNDIYDIHINTKENKLYHEYYFPFKEDWSDYNTFNIDITKKSGYKSANITVALINNKGIILAHQSFALLPADNLLKFDLRNINNRELVGVMSLNASDEQIKEDTSIEVKDMYLSNLNNKTKNYPDPLYILPNHWELGGSFKNHKMLYVATRDKEYLCRTKYLHGRKDFNFCGYIKTYFNTTQFGHKRDNPEFNLWLSNLKKHDIKYVVIGGNFSKKELPEMIWVEENPGMFEVVFTSYNGVIRVYSTMFGKF